MRNRTGTVAIVVSYDESQKNPVLVDRISDDREIAALEVALKTGEEAPLEAIYAMRKKQLQEDEDFGDYVEDLLSKPFVRQEVMEHGVQWLKSKIRIEEYQRTEAEATRVIADYAFKVFLEDPERKDFMLAGPAAKVRIRVFTLPKGQLKNAA
jgi:hypothetical protein